MTHSKNRPSLPEVHRSIEIPNNKGFWRKLLAYAGPGYLGLMGEFVNPFWLKFISALVAIVIVCLNMW